METASAATKARKPPPTSIKSSMKSVVEPAKAFGKYALLPSCALYFGFIGLIVSSVCRDETIKSRIRSSYSEKWAVCAEETILKGTGRAKSNPIKHIFHTGKAREEYIVAVDNFVSDTLRAFGKEESKIPQYVTKECGQRPGKRTE